MIKHCILIDLRWFLVGLELKNHGNVQVRKLFETSDQLIHKLDSRYSLSSIILNFWVNGILENNRRSFTSNSHFLLSLSNWSLLPCWY